MNDRSFCVPINKGTLRWMERTCGELLPSLLPCGMAEMLEDGLTVQAYTETEFLVSLWILLTVYDTLRDLPKGTWGVKRTEAWIDMLSVLMPHHARLEIELATRRRRTATNLDGYYYGQRVLDL